MKGTESFWPTGQRRCDGISSSHGRRCFVEATFAVEGDIAPLRYCKLHGRDQARQLQSKLVPA